MRKIAVIGGGASGLMAAVTAASEGAEVFILEHKDKVGRKILSTGNGRCNFTNLAQEPIYYHSENMMFPWHIVEKFNAQQTIAFFLKLGIYSKNRNGYLYPHSDQASAVLDVLRMEAARLGVHVITGAECQEIIPGKKKFRIDRGRAFTCRVRCARDCYCNECGPACCFHTDCYSGGCAASSNQREQQDKRGCSDCADFYRSAGRGGHGDFHDNRDEYGCLQLYVRQYTRNEQRGCGAEYRTFSCRIDSVCDLL